VKIKQIRIAWYIIPVLFFLVDCTITHKITSLTPDQATAIAIRLANDKASTIYHFQPFRDCQPAKFTERYWIWVQEQGYGAGDIQATVKIAVDGSTNDVDLKLLDSRRSPSGGAVGE
jgi:hypothetical protein